jgi:hypothetical protein
MKKISSKYSSHFKETTCRPHADRPRRGDSRDHITCFEKLMGEAISLEFDLNELPLDFFDYPMCHNSTGGAGLSWCYKRIVSAATSSPSYPRKNLWHINAQNLLDSMMHSRLYEKQLYEMKRICDENNTCLEDILYPHQSTDGARAIQSLLEAYSNENGIIDTESVGSPFYGEKCKYLGYDTGYENCLETAVKGVSRLFDAYGEGAKKMSEELADSLLSQHMFQKECGTLKFISLLSITSRNFRKYIRNV